MVPGGELEHGVECDKRANFSNMEGGVHLKKMFKIERERRREERTEDEHEGKDEQPIDQSQRRQIVGWNWWKTSGTSKRPVYSRTGDQR